MVAVCSLATFLSSFCSHGFHLCVNILFVSTRTGMWSSNAVLSVPFVGSRYSASAALRLMPARCTMLNSNLDKRCHHRASFTDASDIFISHLKDSWFVLSVNRLPSRCGRSKNIAHTTVRHFFCVGASFHSDSFSARDQYPTGLSVSYSCVWSSTHRTCSSTASVPMVYCSFAGG